MSGPRCFELRRVLGQGAFGHVYLADLTSAGGFRKTVALKLLNPQMAHSSDAAQRLRDEARVLGLLRHRHIVAVDDLVRVEGRWAMVMEFVPGQDLEALLQPEREGGPLKAPLRAAGQIAAAVASALDAAWGDSFSGSNPLRVIHRDIKPSNIRITRDGQVKVLDFGIARGEFQEREARTTEIRYGSIPYMSPERLLGEDDTPAGDVYALGSVFQELLTGTGMGRAELGPDRHEAQRAQVLERVAAEVGEDSWALEIIGDTLHYDAEKRPTAGQLRDRLQHHLDETGGMRLERWCAEHVPPEPVGDTSGLLGRVFTEESVPTGTTGALDAAATHSWETQPRSSAPTIIPGAATGEVSDDGPPHWQPPPEAGEDRKGPPVGLIAGAVGAILALTIGAVVLFGGLGTETGAVGQTAQAALSPAVGPEQPVRTGAVPDPEEAGPTELAAGSEEAPVDPSPAGSGAEEAPASVDVQPAATKASGKSTKASSGRASSSTSTASAPKEASPPPAEGTATQAGSATEAAPAETLRAVKFAVDGASTVQVACGGVTASGSSSALVRNLPAGVCSVQAQVEGQELSAEVRVDKPRGYTCTASGGSLTCR